MKRFLLILGCMLFILSVMAEEVNTNLQSPINDINLETQTKKTYNLGAPKFDSATDYNKDISKSEPQDFSKQNPNTKRSAKFGKKKTYKDFSVGSESTQTTTSDTYSSSNTVYSEYEKKNFKINSSYTKNTTQNQAGQDKGTLSVTPEYKLNNHVSVQNKYSTNMNDNSNKGEIKMNIKPFKDDRMNMGVGVGQKYSESGTSSQVNFSTNFRW